MNEKRNNYTWRREMVDAIEKGDEESLLMNKKTLEVLQRRERELEDMRSMFQLEHAEREQRFSKEIAEREKALTEREDLLRAAVKEDEARAASFEQEMGQQRRLMRHEIEVRKAEHTKAIKDLELQKEQFKAEFQKKIEAKSEEYVNDALISLSKSEQAFFWTSVVWAALGLFALLVALPFVYLLARSANADIIMNKDISWLLVLFSAAKGLLLLGVTYAVVGFCGKFSRAYMHESLKSAERKHAIRYGKFYLGVYGAGSDWDKLKEAFAQWNISASSAFSEGNSKSTDASLNDVLKLLTKGVEQLNAGPNRTEEKV